jgi:predicted TIM-barrel fold metal-dependent hydrolase
MPHIFAGLDPLDTSGQFADDTPTRLLVSFHCRTTTLMPVRSPIIDADIHPTMDPRRVVEYLPEPWKTRYGSGNRSPGTLGYWNSAGFMQADAVTEDGDAISTQPETLSKLFFDRYDLEYGILNSESAIHNGVGPELDFAAAVLSAMNDVLAQEWLPVDSRFRGSINVAPSDPVLAAKEIHRLGNHPGMVQVMMGSGARVPYGQRFYHPIYEAAVAYDLPVAIHPGNEGVGITGAPNAAGYPSSYMEWHTTLVNSYVSHLVSLVTEGVFVKYPTLKFVMVEGGISWLPPLMWRLDKNWKALRLQTPWLERKPSEYIQEHVRMTTQPIEEPDNPQHLKYMLEMFDVEQMVMFSSDFPHWDGDTVDFAARPFSPQQRTRVLNGTARDTYNFDK